MPHAHVRPLTHLIHMHTHTHTQPIPAGLCPHYIPRQPYGRLETYLSLVWSPSVTLTLYRLSWGQATAP